MADNRHEGEKSVLPVIEENLVKRIAKLLPVSETSPLTTARTLLQGIYVESPELLKHPKALADAIECLASINQVSVGEVVSFVRSGKKRNSFVRITSIPMGGKT